MRKRRLVSLGVTVGSYRGRAAVNASGERVVTMQQFGIAGRFGVTIKCCGYSRLLHRIVCTTRVVSPLERCECIQTPLGDPVIVCRPPEIRKKSVHPNVRAFFVCTRSDLLSGEPARVLDIPLVQAFFVDRIAIRSIVSSGITVWGEDLLARVALLPIRRLDVAKAFFGLFN